MNHELLLSLELLEQSPKRLLFELRIDNRSKTNLLLPCPEIHGLRFGNKANFKQSEWYTFLQSSDWNGFTLASNQSKTIQY